MESIVSKLEAVDWEYIASALHEKGYAIIPEVITGKQCTGLIHLYDKPGGFRKTVNMDRHRFGSGEYKYFDYPLPGTVQILRELLYPKLAPIANIWMKVLNIDIQYPGTLGGLQRQCQKNNQRKPTPLILRYGKGGFNTLHQDLYGEIYFPLQAVVFLNEPGIDFEGGEFVLIQQVPRSQSKAIVLGPKKGDILIFTTNFRPVRGVKGFFRVNMKHGVSELHSGVRHTLGIIFHDALN